MTVLPSAALNHMSGKAQANVLEHAAKQPIETFTILYYGDRQAEAFLGEIDKDTWIERSDEGNFFYEELFEKANRVVLYDESRDRKLIIDLKKFDVTVVDDGAKTHFEIIDISQSSSPFIPPDWLV
jgi:hypothetical protein